MSILSQSINFHLLLIVSLNVPLQQRKNQFLVVKTNYLKDSHNFIHIFIEMLSNLLESFIHELEHILLLPQCALVAYFVP